MKPNITILEAMADRQIFGSFFKRSVLRGDTWRAWRAFVASLFALPLDGDALETFRRHTGRSIPPRDAFREAYLIAGRRSGKSLISALVATFLAAFKNYGDVLAPGETGTLMVIAADRRQARVIFNYICAFFDTPMLRSLVASKLKESLVLKNRVTIEIHTCSFRATRGYTLIGAICDELAFWNVEGSANPDSEVIAALRPGLATTGGLLLGVSTPYARRGALWEAFRSHFGKDGSDVLVWRAASREMNPALSHAIVAGAYLRDAASAKAEYGAQFREDIENFIPVEVVEAAIVPGRFELPPSAECSHVAFVDPSGGRSDSMTLAIAHAEEGETAVLDVLREVAPPFNPEEAVAEFSRVLLTYGLAEVTGDAYAAAWPCEQFRKHGIEYRVSERSRSEIYLALLPLLTSGRVQLLDNERLKSQLIGLERRTARAGRDSVDHAPGAHDDVANAAAGALTLAVGDTAAYGLLDWVAANGPAEVLRNVRTAPEPKPAAQVEALARRMRPQRVEEPATPPEPERVCPRCSATCVSMCSGQLRCNACGHQWWRPGTEPEMQVVTRGDVLSGRFGNRTRRL
jgi:hypothetical protein